MSYAEHGSRIFLAGRSSVANPIVYGDYVMPRKRSEGRLKLHDSCADIRAWSPNSLENSRYFRELTEHSSPVGKVIPFNVMIDNIAGFTSQAQTELQFVRNELQKYKSLRLTAEQEKHLQNYGNHEKAKDLSNAPSKLEEPFFKNEHVNISKSVPMIHSNSYFSIHIPPDVNYQIERKNRVPLMNRNKRLQVCSTNSLHLDLLLSADLAALKRGRTLSFPKGVCREITPCIEYADVALQVETETREIGVQFGGVDDYVANKVTFNVESRSSSVVSLEFSDQDEKNHNNLQTSNHEEMNFSPNYFRRQNSFDVTKSQSSSDTGLDFEMAIKNSSHKEIIIEKDSEIIVLKNDLCVKVAELDELRDLNRNLQNTLKEREEKLNDLQTNFMILEEKLFEVEYQYNYETGDLQEKLHAYQNLADQLKVELNDKNKSCHLHTQEIEKLCLYVKKTDCERDSLFKKTQKTEQHIKEAETLASEQIKNALQETDVLKKENQEQSCKLADQEDEIKRLLILIEPMSIKCNEQAKSEDNLRSEIHEKDMLISRYKKKFNSMKKKVIDFFSCLKRILKSLEEVNGFFEDPNCENIIRNEIDMQKEASGVLSDVNVIMTRLQTYAARRSDVWEQIDEGKHFLSKGNEQAYSNKNQSLSETDSEEDFDYETKIDRDIALGLLRVHCPGRWDQSYMSDNSESDDLLNEARSNMNTFCPKNDSYEHIKLNAMDRIKEIQDSIIGRVFKALERMNAIENNLLPYLEVERPAMQNMLTYMHEALRAIEAAFNYSPKRKERISELYCRRKEEYEKFAAQIKPVAHNYLFIALHKINQSLVLILHGQLEKILQDEQINRALETHMKSCIFRINEALQGAGDHRMQMIEEMTKKHYEIQKKNFEITELKKLVELQNIQKGEGDCMRQEELLKVIDELRAKDVLVAKLEEQLIESKTKLFSSNNDCNMLRKQIKNIENIKSRLCVEIEKNKEELEFKNQKIAELSQNLHGLFSLKDLVKDLENQSNELEMKLNSLQNENDELRMKLVRTNEMIFEKDQQILEIKNSLGEKENTLMRTIAKHKIRLEENQSEIAELKNKNKILNATLKDTEEKFAEMNIMIKTLTEDNDKIHVIRVLQEDITKLDKNEKKLKMELNSLKSQFSCEENATKEIESKFETFSRENDSLKGNIEYWKNENYQLTSQLCDITMEEKFKSDLYSLPKKICERLSNIKDQLDSRSEEDLFFDEITVRHNSEMKMYECSRKHAKENEVEETWNKILKDDIAKENYLILDKLKYLEDENKQKQEEINKLMRDVEARESDIQNLKESIDYLRRENTDLHTLLKSQVEEYQSKLMLMKKNYDSSVNALCDRHNEIIETLQRRFEDEIMGERNTFDSESWLQSLNVKELMNLQERICSSSKLDMTGLKDKNLYLYQDNILKDKPNREVNELDEKFLASQKTTQDIVQRLEKSEFNANENFRLENQWSFASPNRNKNLTASPLRDSKLKQNFRRIDAERQKATNEKEQEHLKNDTFVKRRLNFINQCSTYHKLNNSY